MSSENLQIDLSCVPGNLRKAVAQALSHLEDKTQAWIHVEPFSPHWLLARVKNDRLEVTHYFRAHDRSNATPQVCRAIGLLDEVDWFDADATAHHLLALYKKGYALPSNVKNYAGPAGLLTLADAMRMFGDEQVKQGAWKSSSNRRSKMEGIIRLYIEPEFSHQRFDAIPAEALVKKIRDMRKIRSAAYARDAKSFVVGTLIHMAAEGYSTTALDTAKKISDFLRYLLPKSARKQIFHRAALPVKDLPEFMHQLQQIDGMPARALEFLILTCSRVRPAIEMQWKDVDLVKRVWSCPPETMKRSDNGRFDVQLSYQAVALLQKLKEENLARAKPSKYVFHNRKGDGHICADLAQVICRMNAMRAASGLSLWTDPEASNLLCRDVRVTVHGFRSTFKTWACSEEQPIQFSEKAVERCLHHRTDDFLQACYDRNTYPLQQRNILLTWANYCYSYFPENESESGQ